MQTFLPYPDFRQSLEVLDIKRLGKQRVEALQVVRALQRPGYGWSNHPAVLMWKGYEEGLACYGLLCCELWVTKGYGDTCAASITKDIGALGISQVRSQEGLSEVSALPPWLGDSRLHLSHQSALVRKNPGHYRPYFPDVPANLPYFWPVRSPTVVAAEQERLRKRRSRAAKRGWATRRQFARQRQE